MSCKACGLCCNKDIINSCLTNKVIEDDVRWLKDTVFVLNKKLEHPCGCTKDGIVYYGVIPESGFDTWMCKCGLTTFFIKNEGIISQQTRGNVLHELCFKYLSEHEKNFLKPENKVGELPRVKKEEVLIFLMKKYFKIKKLNFGGTNNVSGVSGTRGTASGMSSRSNLKSTNF